MNARLRYGIPIVATVLISVAAVLVAANTDPARVGVGPIDAQNLPVGEAAGAIDGATGWINSPPLGATDLQGKVVVYGFWTHSCINCVRTIPYLRSWYDRYAADGLVIVGVHSPEFAFEHSRANVEAATRRLGVTWPVALDNNKTIWDTPERLLAKYIADRDGDIR